MTGVRENSDNSKNTEETATDSIEVRLLSGSAAEMRELFAIFQEVLRGGDVFPYPEETNQEEFAQIWLPPHSFSYVAVDNSAAGQILGAYYVKPQWPGRGSHVATATYMVAEKARGRGVGRLLGEHSLMAARQRGYSAMQFNLVISTNKPAVALWQKIGFKIIGTVPGGFRHRDLGDVDTYLMHCFL